VIESTSVHQDIVPTLLTEAVGCDTPTHHYSNGLSLFNLPEKRSTVIASYSFSAYWVDGIIYERESGKKYSWRDINERAPGLNTQAIRKLWGEENQFRQTSVPPKP
jgi:membrane-anchored protein YejM (alkaline phosphatase superfamily)